MAALMTRPASRRGRCVGSCLLGLILLFASVSRGSTQAGLSEYEAKAVFLLNFAQFIEWPAAAFSNPTEPIVIGVLGVDPFGPLLDEAFAGENVEGRSIVVERFTRVEDITRCHILFISRSESRRLDRVLAALRGRSILTVGDTEGYALRGVMIRFISDKNRLRMRINMEAAKAAGLVVSSKLLRSSEIVTTQGK